MITTCIGIQAHPAGAIVGAVVDQAAVQEDLLHSHLRVDHILQEAVTDAAAQVGTEMVLTLEQGDQVAPLHPEDHPLLNDPAQMHPQVGVDLLPPSGARFLINGVK